MEKNMANSFDFDIAVIGGGPGGYVAAIKAAKEGRCVCLIEKAKVGGVCLNEGCIPTKTLIKAANIYSELKEAAKFGIEGVDPNTVSISMPKLQQRREAVIRQLVGGVAGLLRAAKVTMVDGAASFVNSHTVRVGSRTITSDYFIIATGSRTLMPSFITREGQTNIITSREALELKEIPKSIAIIGGGVIGVEFAYLFNTLGAKVTVLELLEHIMPMVDTEVSMLVRQRLEKAGVIFHTGARVQTVRDDEVLFEQNGRSHSVRAGMVLMSVGRVPCTEGLNADKIGLEFNGAAIRTDDTLATNIVNIYAIGDVNGKVMLAHTASHEALVAVDNILGRSSRMHYEKIPACIYLNPEVACIGLTEKQTRERGMKIKVGRFPMAANGKSLVEGDTQGLVKVILDSATGEILGVHLYGHHVTEMIAGISVAMTLEATAEEIMHSIHPHPTVNESIPEAFMAAYGKAVHCM